MNNAGANVLERSWAKLTPERVKTVLDANLNSAFYCAVAALAIMRPQKDGLLIHTASWAGRFVGLVSGPAYVAAKHGVVAMSYSINMEEFQHGIRSTVLCPERGGDADPRPAPDAGLGGGPRAHDPARAHGGPDPLYCEAAGEHLPERDRHQSDLEPRLRAPAAGLGPKR